MVHVKLIFNVDIECSVHSKANNNQTIHIVFHYNLMLTPSFTILTHLDGEVLAQITAGWPWANVVTWTQVKIRLRP